MASRPSPSLLARALGCGILVLVAAGLMRGADALAEAGTPQEGPFVGVTTDGTVLRGLFAVRSTGVSTAPVRAAAEAFLASLSAAERAASVFPVDGEEWRQWNNVHRASRAGVRFRDLTEARRQTAYDLLAASLSARGLQQSRDIMRLDGHMAELRSNPDEYGEDLYHLIVLGEPHATAPWGWQLEGHHLIVNYFVLGDQVVMTPTFMGSEPVTARSGRYAGTEVLQLEQDRGLALMRSLDAAQQRTAILAADKAGNNAQSQAFRDNLELPHAGLRATDLTAAQRTALLELVSVYVGALPEGHARVRMAEVEARLEDTWFAWVGATAEDAVFYYRIHSPVILIEFDHQRPVALEGPRVPGRDHIHTVVRTPNGNDYGRDLLRQHYEAARDDPDHVHGRMPPVR